MNSKSLLEKLVEESNTINDLISFEINHNKRNKHLEDSLYYFTILFNELYQTSLVENFYWEYCDFQTYLKTIENRLILFLNSKKDLIPLDFYNLELLEIERDCFDNKPLWLKQNISINKYLFNIEFSNLRNELIKQIDYSNKRKIEFLKYKINNYDFEFEETKSIFQPINKYPRVFVDDFSFLLFEQLYLDFKDTKNKLADFSFIYRKMIYDKYIHEDFRPVMFKNWISQMPYQIQIDGEIKQLDNCTTKNKEIAYKNAKENIKI